MRSHHGSVFAYARLLALGLVALLAGCGSGEAANPTAAKPTPEPISTAAPRDITSLPDFSPLEPGAYYIDPDADPDTPLRVLYTIPATGWSMWIGAAKFAKDGHVGVSITTVTNLVRHGCRDHSAADSPVGASVDELATALRNLAPFRVTSPPRDVNIYGYHGKHLELAVPNLPVKGRGDNRRFVGCVEGQLKSWIAPTLSARGGYAFYGYSSPGFREEFWILDVEDTRLVIAAERSPGSPQRDLAELCAILDSIQIET